MAWRPPRRRREQDDVGGRSEEDPKRRRRSRFEDIHARHREQRPAAEAGGRAARPRIVPGLEDGVAGLQNKGAASGRGHVGQQHGVDPYELRIVAGGQQRLARQHDGRQGRDVADPADDGVLQRGPGPADDRKTRDVDQVARQQIRRLLGFDQRRAGVVPDINPMALFPRPRMHRDVFDEHRLPDPRAGHGPANPHPAIELIHRVMGVEAGDRPHRERPRFRSAGVDDRVGGAPGEQRDAANLPRLVVEGARVTAKPDPGVDEPREILRREIPEPGPHFAAVHRDVDKQRLSRLGHPGPLADADRLDVLAIEDPAQKRRIRDVPGR